MAPRQNRRMVDPDYAGQIKTGIGAKLNGQMTSSNSFKTFQTPMTGGYNPSKLQGQGLGEKGALLTGNQIAYARNQGAPLTGSASGVKNITLKDVGETLTQGAFSVNEKGLTMDPVALAFAAVPFGKFGKIGGIAKKLAPAAVRFDTAASNIVRRSASTLRRATGAAEDASWAGDRAAELFNAGKQRASTPIRTSRNIYEDVGHGAFDENLGTRLTGENVFGSSLADAEAAVRAGLARVEYTGSRTKVYRDLVGEGWQREAEVAAAAATEKRLAAEALARRSQTVVDRGISGTKAELRRRVAAVREARLREARLRAAGVPIAPKRGGGISDVY